MSGNPTLHIERRMPNRKDAVVFRLKTALLQARRTVLDRASGRLRRFPTTAELKTMPVIGRSVTPLWTESEPEERSLVAGKIHNLRIAISSLDGVEVSGEGIFSFWRHVGRASKRRGFVEGRELREGCIIPSVGGGLCQISNALYDAAVQANFQILERHRHTQVVAGSLAEQGRDATVFWNYIDLRFRSAKPFRIEVRLDPDNLIVEMRGEKITEKTLHQIGSRGLNPAELGSCATCEVDDCHRVVKPSSTPSFGRSAWLVDEYMAEFDEYLQRERSDEDLLCLPIDGKRFRKSNYAWNLTGFREVRQSYRVTVVRAYRSRKLAMQGAARQHNLLDMYEALADSYAKRVSYDCLHVSVQQNLLPFLWRKGHLGGRTFDVLMTALPMAEIQRRLDHAAVLHPESATLGDFRADPNLLAAESEALQNARRIVTPHTEIASLFGERAVRLDWVTPTATSRNRPPNAKPTIVFPASTVGRKGCYELREALRGLDVKLVALGPYVESTDFWDGFDVDRSPADWLERAELMVLPAFVEHKPRRLLLAAAAGIPIIATSACGIGPLSGVTFVETGDADCLRDAIRSVLAARP